MFPSSMAIGLGVVIAAALAIVDWYVWRAAPVLPYPLEDSAPRPGDHDETAADLKEVA